MRDYKSHGVPIALLSTETIHKQLSHWQKLRIGPKLASKGVTIENIRDRLQLELEIRAMGLGEVE